MVYAMLYYYVKDEIENIYRMENLDEYINKPPIHLQEDIVVLYCIVSMGWSLLPNALRPL